MKGTILILAALFLFGCSDRAPSTVAKKPVIFTSILPQVGLIKRIAGDQFSIIPLVGEGQSPHSYEPTARQLAELSRAEALLTIGIPFETHLLKKIQPLYPELPIIKTQHGVQLRNMTQDHGEHCTHNHGTKDPHLWLAPLNAKIMVENSTRALIALDPENAPQYQENADAVIQELVALDAEIRAIMSPFNGMRFYVFHPSFGYFAAAYGLEQIPIELYGKSPTPRQLAELIEQAKRDQVQVIFVSKQFPIDSAQAIAHALGGRVIPIDPLAEDLIANLRKISESIVQALEP